MRVRRAVSQFCSRHGQWLVGGSLAAVLVAGGCTDTTGSGDPAAGTGAPADTTKAASADAALPTAPEDQRVDLEAPSFSEPTTVDNPLFPISEQHSAVLLGNDDGHPLKVEITLLPKTKAIDWNGERVETLVSQFVSYVDGCIHEVALDSYAQADDGAVWFFGEDVFRYEDGVVLDKEGTWYAGKDGPAAMIMPANPRVGDVFRSENIPGFIVEEVVVKAVGQRVAGPRGPVDGAMVGQELHILEGVAEDKTFAPGYGEFTSGVDAGIETMALSVPTDAQSEPAPAALAELAGGALDVFDAAAAGDWARATAGLDAVNAAWATYRASSHVPELLAVQMDSALAALAGDSLMPAVHGRNAVGSRNAALDVAQASLDLQLQYQGQTEVDRTRFDLWARQILVDAGREDPDPGHIAGDVTVLEWVWDRISHTVDQPAAGDIEAHIGALRTAADDEDPAAAVDAGTALQDMIAKI